MSGNINRKPRRALATLPAQSALEGREAAIPRDSSKREPHQRSVDENLGVTLALFGQSKNVLSKHGPGGVGAAIQVIALYSLPSLIQGTAEDI
jgi:hypothetical protein